MKISQKEGFDMTHDPTAGGGVQVRGALVQAHRSELLAEAAAERQAHVAHLESKSGVRRQVGHALVRVGRALADDSPSGAARPA